MLAFPTNALQVFSNFGNAAFFTKYLQSISALQAHSVAM